MKKILPLVICLSAVCGCPQPGWDSDSGTDSAVPTECGNSALNAGEECDLGALNSDSDPDRCRLDCRMPFCGDGIMDLGEACDDANAAAGDGCSSCTLEIPIWCDSYETNDSVATATPIAPGYHSNLTICLSNDNDYYLVNVDPMSTISVTIRMVNGQSGDLDLQLLNSAGSIVATSGRPWDAEHIIHYPTATGGPFYVRVYGYMGSVNGYALEVRIEPINARDCLSNCNSLVPFPFPAGANWYSVVPPSQAYSSTDFVLLVQYAINATIVRYPGTGPLGLSAMSMADGTNPPGHPAGHLNGRDMDMAYWNEDGINDFRIICGNGTDTNSNGSPGVFNDGYFCTTSENIVDLPKQAFYYAKLFEHPFVRVIGIDETLPVQLGDAAGELYYAGVIPFASWDRFDTHMAYGDAGGWAFHHHHTHVSTDAYGW